MPPRRGATARRDRIDRIERRKKAQDQATAPEEAERAQNEIDVLEALFEIVEDAAEELKREIVHVDEFRYQRMHQCGSPLTCTLSNKACSAINQNMPSHMIVGQQQ